VMNGTNTVTEFSENGLVPDSNLDGNFGDNLTPTPISFAPVTFFGLTKQGALSTKLQDNSYDITYTISVHNLGNDTLTNVTAKDSLFGKVINTPASYTIKSAPVATGFLTANSAYNGNSDINLLVAGTSKIGPGQVETIIFTINVLPDTVTVISNSAFGSALHGTVTVADTSNNGTNPDTDANGVWNEPIDNTPTILIIDDSELFVPDGFSPNGDCKNDFFVIKGLTPGSENAITVYNRWGNKVYYSGNYDNSWQGIPNTGGSLGTQKLPQGTYYYILEFKGSDVKPKTGYIILQY